MRLSALLAPAVVALAGASYFLVQSKSKESFVPAESRFDRSAPASERDPDGVADAHDAALVRQALEENDLNEEQATTVYIAAGRRYMRRKLAYEAAKKVKAAPEKLESLRHEMELSRKLCDLAGSLGRRTRQATLMARADMELERRLLYSPGTLSGLADHFEGSNAFNEADLAKMEQAFAARFGRPLPVSARGASAVHRALGFDHRGRFDVAVSPSQVEGIWVRQYLTAKNVPFFAFRSAVRGQATGAHIHIGPASGRRLPSD